jgi:predicted permease
MPRRPLDRHDRDIRDEIDFYLEERGRELEAQGMSPGEARRAALAAFGDPERIARRTRNEWKNGTASPGDRMMTELWQHLRYAARTLIREPAFALAAVITLALAIGANAAIFGVADAVLLRAPPVRDPGSLVAVYTTCRAGDPRCASSYPDYVDYREASALAGLAAFTEMDVTVAAPGDTPAIRDALLVTGDYFDVLGVAPALGRLLQPADDRPDAPFPALVLAHDTWASEFGRDAGVIGRTLHVNQEPYEIVGVAPRGFRGLALGSDPDLFIPITARDMLGLSQITGEVPWEARDIRWIDQLVGRLAPGASTDMLRQQMQGISSRLEEAHGRDGRGITVDVSARYMLPVSGREDLTRIVGVLLGVVGLTLLLACANIANLVLARATARQREIGVRLALGSGSGRLARQMLVESLVLAALGGVLGLAVALGLLRLLSAFELPGGVPLAALDLRIDGRVFAFALAVSAVTGVAFGLLPALRAARRDPATALRSGAASADPEGRRLRKLLVSAQVAGCVVLLTGSGLFLSGLRSGLTYDIGVRPEGLALTRFDFSLLAGRAGATSYEDPETMVARVDRMLERVQALPGVTSTAVSTTVPLQGSGNYGFFVEVDGYQAAPDEEMRVEATFATEDFFRTLGTPLVTGRDIDTGMTAADEPQVVIDREMAEAYWPGGNAVGGIVQFGGRSFRVAGVTENVAWRSVPQPPLNTMTIPLRQLPRFATNGSLTLLARTSREPEALLGELRRAVVEMDPNLAPDFVQTMEEVLGAQLSPQRMGALLFTAFGTLAGVLSFVGIAGVVAYLVGRQKREIGIRIALGASRTRVQAGAMQGMLLPVAGGLTAGLVAAYLLRGTVQGFLLEASAAAPGAYVAAAALLALVALCATWIPARAASRVDPVRVLKAE